MNAQVTQILGEIIKRFGAESLDDPKRFAGILQDYCKGEYKRERKSLVDALDENIPNNLLNLSKSMGIELLVDQQTRRLLDSRMMSEDAARDIVETWALALGVLDSPLTRPPVMVQPSPVGTPTPLPLPSAKSKKSAVQTSLLLGIGGIGLLILIVIIGGVSWLLNGLNKPGNETNAQTVQASVQQTLSAMEKRTPTLTLQGESTTEVIPTITRTPIASETPLATLTPEMTSTPEGNTRISQKDGMEMVYIPPGEFLMGSADSDSEADANEKPQHKVYLDGYWMDKTEVTNAMFAKYVEATGYKTDAEKQGSGWAYNSQSDSWADTKGANWQHPGGPASNIDSKTDHPVVQVSWNDAKGYCEWGGGRLPSEAEWEKAARGEDRRKYPWGDASPDNSLLNYNMNIKDTAAVGSYPSGASAYGLLDMSGNVMEWVNDWYDENYYKNTPERNPTGTGSGSARVLRGGSWDLETWYVRASFRTGGSPVVRNYIFGFRCVR